MEKTILSLIYLLSAALAFGQEKAMLVADRFVSDCCFALERTAVSPQTFPAEVSSLREIVLSEDGTYRIGYNTSAYPREAAYDTYEFENYAELRFRAGAQELPAELTGARYVAFVREDGSADPRAKLSVLEHGKTQLRYSVSPAAVFRKHSYIEWHYAVGATLSGLRCFALATGERKYIDHIDRIIDTNLANMPLFRAQYDDGCRRTQNYRLFRSAMLDDTGGPSLPYVEAAAAGNGSEELRALIDSMACYVYERQYRLPAGAWVRAEPKWTVWCDDMFMGGAFLTRLYDLTGEHKHLSEACRQAAAYYKYLYDPDSGLMYHAWNDTEGRHLGAHWGRANGWYLWAISDILLRLPQGSEEFGKLLDIHNSLLRSIVRYQAEDGMWHQVIDCPETYEESSATCAFVFALARAVRRGWLPPEYLEYVSRGWAAIESRISSDGRLSGICRSMSVQDDVEGYNSRETADNDPRGLGLFFMAASEMNLIDGKI